MMVSTLLGTETNQNHSHDLPIFLYNSKEHSLFFCFNQNLFPQKPLNQLIILLKQIMTEAKMFRNYFGSKKIIVSIENYRSPRGSKKIKIRQKSKTVK